MKFIQNLSMRHKLLILILPAMLVLLMLFVERTHGYLGQYQAMQHLQQQAALLQLLDPVVTELQKERGRSAVFLSSRQAPAEATAALQAQYQSSDRVLSGWQQGLTQWLQNNEALPPLTDLQQQLQKLSQVRNQVLAHAIGGAEALRIYTDLVHQGMAFTGRTLRSVQEPDIQRRMSAYAAISNLTEVAGLERARGAAYLRMGAFERADLLPVTRLQGQQESLQAQVPLFLYEQEMTDWNSALNSADNRQFEGFRQRLNDPQAAAAITPAQWFQQATVRISVLNNSKEQLVQIIAADAVQLQQAAATDLWTETALMALVVLLVVVMSVVISAQVNGQVGGLLKVIRTSMQEKDLSVRVPVSSLDEIGEVAAAVQELFLAFSRALDQLDNASLQLAAAMEESATTAGKNALQLEHQQQQVEQVATATEEMSATSEQISQHTQRVADAAVSVRSKSEAGEETVKQSVNQVQRLAGSVQGVDQLMQDLQHRSDSMIEVIDVIRNVADQTNLLALNAAIEAARAGEHGRGFAVVADEVRTLAQQTHSSTQKIQEIIESFTELAATATHSIESSHKIADEALLQSKELERTFDDILNDVKRISDMASEIAIASEEQVAVSREVARSMEMIRDDSAQTYQGAMEIRSVTQNQSALATELKDLAGEFKTH
ncbi:methyl-accepting chemotaxis protein [Venatoribacter cucullus]|uniref:methyl-accepting chemotaxis protein n=1 Tax=Venatoribacter cucullus TaxID=2661630 RepID=UPI00223EB0C8|nr:methyl-accepting chemotaxis protein [Venatoribacter cucullus]UZK03014.1 chemotaxis protein [Venatoribacter cucullus]